MVTVSVSSATLPASPSAQTSTLASVPTSQTASTTSIPKSNSSSTHKVESNDIPAGQAPPTTPVVPKGTLTAPSSKDNTVLQSEPTNSAPVPENNSSISAPENSSAQQQAARKRRSAGTSPPTPPRSEVQTLPLYKTVNNISDYKYSGKVSEVVGTICKITKWHGGVFGVAYPSASIPTSILHYTLNIYM